MSSEPVFSGFEHFDLAGVEERTRLAMQIWAEGLANPSVRALQVETIEIVRTAFVQAVRERQGSDELDPSLDPDSVARAMIALFQGLIVQRTWYREIDVDGYRAVGRALLGGLRRVQSAEATACEGRTESSQGERTP